MKCPKCDYEWIPRKKDPKACPRCKRRLDYYKKKDDPLSEVMSMERGFQRTTYVMSIITERLKDEGILPVIVGGAAVEFYTRDWYATGDIDLAIDNKKREEFQDIMEEFGFDREGRMWVREDLNLYIEIPADIKDISKDRITEVKTEKGSAYMIGLEDILFDRIQAAEHWKSEGDREQAIRIGAAFYDDINWEIVRKRCKKELSEGMLDKVLEAIKDEKSNT